MTVQMIDVSSNNHPTGQAINWAAVKKGNVAAVMIKATEGLNYVNPWLTVDAKGAADAGLLVGYYHFCHPGLDDVSGEANNFWQHVKNLPRSLGLAADVESTQEKWVARSSTDLHYVKFASNDLGNYAQAFLGTLPTQVLNKELYCDLAFFNQLPGAPWEYELWIADYSASEPQLNTAVWAWQRSQTGSVPGVEGDVDLNFLYAV
jgi:lysozyme